MNTTPVKVEAAGRFNAAASVLEAALSDLDEMLVRAQRMLAECPVRKCRASDFNPEGNTHAL
jgi:hypothetical protein